MSWSGSQNYITGRAYVKTNSSISEGRIGACAYLYDGAGLLINSTKAIWNAAGEKDVGVGAGVVRNIGGNYYAEDRETQIGVFEFSDPLRSLCKRVAIDGWRPFLFGGAMNISQLEYLVSAIHLGSYSRAAKEQFVTPQAVSKAIRTLESELGLKLIVSSGKTISPTDVGLLIAEEAEAVIHHAGKIGSIASSYRLRISDEGKMRCAIASWGEGDSLIPPFVKGLLGNSGWVESLIELPNERCLSGLRLGYIDFAVLLGTPMLEGFKRKFLYSVSPNLLVKSNNPLVSRDALSVHDLKTVKLALPFHAEEVCPYLKDLASDYGVNLHFEMLNNSRESIGNFFLDNEDAALLAIRGSAWEVLIPDVVSLPFVSQEGVHFPVSAIYSDSRSENADRLCDFITSNLKNKSD